VGANPQTALSGVKMSDTTQNSDENGDIELETNASEVSVSGDLEEKSDYDPAYDLENENYTYRCPYCEISYQNEILVRVHISRSEDTDHLNYNGFMPDSEIRVVNGDGEVVDAISRRPQEIDTANITLDTFPDDFSEQHKHILLVAARNHEETTYTVLEEKVNERLEEYDVDSPSYSMVRRVILQFYEPQYEGEITNRSRKTDPKRLTELTHKQQAIVIARLISPEASAATIAEQVNCAISYPPQVYDLAASVINKLDTRVEEENDIIDIITSELSADDIDQLLERGLLDDVPISGEALTTDTDIDEENKANWGSPIQYQDGMSADPQKIDQQNGTGDVEPSQHTQSDEVSNSKPDVLSAETGDQSSEASVEEPNLKRDLRKLKRKVQFLRETFERGDSVENQNKLLISFARQFEKQCEEILHTSAENK
jgi:hypothetical protein